MLKPRKSDTTVTDEEREILDKYAWMIRPCSVYIQEYSVCKSLRGRFDQYYTQGKLSDCKRWKDDRADCREYTKEGNFQAGIRVIENERKLIEDRLKSFHNNDVMKERIIRPPPNWNRELPYYIAEKHEGSYLSEHLDELSKPPDYPSSSACVIL